MPLFAYGYPFSHTFTKKEYLISSQWYKRDFHEMEWEGHEWK